MTKAENAAFLRSLEPKDWGGWKVEEFAEYLPRAKKLLPNFPVDVLEHWIYRHYGDAVGTYGWLGFTGLRFEQTTWPTDRILGTVGVWAETDWTLSWTRNLRERRAIQKESLGAYMIEHGTWPVPILVIENFGGLALPNGVPLAAPLHLMEGQHRFGYLRALRDDDRWSAKPEHGLWLIRYRPELLMDYWPMNYAEDV